MLSCQPPSSDFLGKDFRLEPDLKMEVLIKEILVRWKNCSHCNFQDLHSLVRRILVSLPRILVPNPHGKSTDLEVGGVRTDLDTFSHVRLTRMCILEPQSRPDPNSRTL